MSTVSGKSCSWCHAMNPADVSYCAECGHEAHTPRIFCSCPACHAARHVNAFSVGDRVIFQCPSPKFDGLRGNVTEARPGGYYALRLDNGAEWPEVWESKLAREADNPDYPLPGAAE